MDVITRSFRTEAVVNHDQDVFVGLLARSIRAKVVRPTTLAYRGFEVVDRRGTEGYRATRSSGQVGRYRGNDGLRFAHLCLLARGFQDASRRRSASRCNSGSRYVVIRRACARASGPHVGLRIRRFRRAKGERH